MAKSQGWPVFHALLLLAIVCMASVGCQGSMRRCGMGGSPFAGLRYDCACDGLCGNSGCYCTCPPESGLMGGCEPSCGCSDPSCGCSEPDCGCSDPSCGCGEPSCGCGEPSCGCGEPSCGCGEPSCGCGEPSCGCGEPSCGCDDICCSGGGGGLMDRCSRAGSRFAKWFGCNGCSGEIYWSEWHNDPPGCEPCDCCGNWIGGAGGYCPSCQ